VRIRATQPLAIRPATPVQFFRAITKNTIATLSGAMSIILLFFGLWLPANQYKDAVFIFAGLSILWAAYRVWVDERSRAIEFEKHLDEPNLAATIDQCYQSSQAPLRLLLRLHVVNKSPARTTVKGTQLEIINDDHIERFTYREDATIGDAQFAVTIFGSDMVVTQQRQLTDLLNEVATHPIERGIHKAGDLIFQFDDATEVRDLAKLRLTLVDAFGKEHRTEQDVPVRKGVWLD
jgi:hypothetical protein